MKKGEAVLHKKQRELKTEWEKKKAGHGEKERKTGGEGAEKCH